MSDQPIHLFNQKQFADNLSVGVGTNTSPSINVNEAISYCVQFCWTGGVGVIGNIYLTASNDDVNFTQIQQTILALTNGAGSHMINIEKPSYVSFKTVVELSSGSLTISSCHANGKRK